MKNLKIDINCDMGESYGRFKIGNDKAIFPYISSCNIACGFHGGDPLTIERTIKLAIQHHVRIGAHPSYPDLSGFGRRKMKINSDELEALLKYQIAALQGMAKSQGAQLDYVKPHGALYNSAAFDEEESRSIIKAIRQVDPQLKLMGLAGAPIQHIAHEAGITFIAEAFADRKYESNGRLRARSNKDAVLHDPAEAAQQVLSIIQQHKVIAADGQSIPLKAESICIHGDNPHVVEILKAIDNLLTQHQITKSAD